MTNGGEGRVNAIKFSAKVADSDGGGILEGLPTLDELLSDAIVG